MAPARPAAPGPVRASAPRARHDRRAPALATLLLLGSCFSGHALWGERCEADAACGPDLACQDDGVCEAVRMCAELTVAQADLRPQVALLLDHSGSMRRCLDDPEVEDACAGDDPPGPSRWDALGDLVRATVPEFAARVDFAVVVFPSDTVFDDTDPIVCDLDDSTAIGFGEPDAAAKILAAVPADDERPPRGENPVREALAGLFAADADAPPRARAIVLVIDNPPNCPARPATKLDIAEKLDPEVLPLVEQYRVDGVLTVVVAISVVDALAPVQAGDKKIDGVNPHDYFSELALAGGAAQAGEVPYLHLSSSTAHDAVVAALHGRLSALTADHDACRVRLAATPDYPDLVALEQGGRLHRADPDCADPEAWRYIGDDRRALQLCPAACERLGAGAPARIRFGCP